MPVTEPYDISGIVLSSNRIVFHNKNIVHNHLWNRRPR
jgi:hypothetical protein